MKTCTLSIWSKNQVSPSLTTKTCQEIWYDMEWEFTPHGNIRVIGTDYVFDRSGNCISHHPSKVMIQSGKSERMPKISKVRTHNRYVLPWNMTNCKVLISATN